MKSEDLIKYIIEISDVLPNKRQEALDYVSTLRTALAEREKRIAELEGTLGVAARA